MTLYKSYFLHYCSKKIELHTFSNFLSSLEISLLPQLAFGNCTAKNKKARNKQRERQRKH